MNKHTKDILVSLTPVWICFLLAIWIVFESNGLNQGVPIFAIAMGLFGIGTILHWIYIVIKG